MFSSARDGALRFPTYAITGSCAAGSSADEPLCVVLAKRSTTRDEPLSSVDVIYGHLFAFMRRHPAVVVVVASIGTHSLVSWPSSVLKYMKGLQMVRSITKDCVSAAIVDAVLAERIIRAVNVVLDVVNGREEIFHRLKALGLV